VHFGAATLSSPSPCPYLVEKGEAEHWNVDIVWVDHWSATSISFVVSVANGFSSSIRGKLYEIFRIPFSDFLI
jgi:hypothetical protein